MCQRGAYAFPHRHGGGACEHGPYADYYHGIRQGLSEEEALQLLWSDKPEKFRELQTHAER